MRRFLLAITLVVAFALPATAATLTWVDNATNELGVRIERAEGSCAAPGPFTEIGSVGVNVTTYVDSTTIVGHQYCYRVRDYNNSLLDGTGVVQFSTYSNTAGIAYPLATPAAASQLTVTP